jgi:hypothetical protein
MLLSSLLLTGNLCATLAQLLFSEDILQPGDLDYPYQDGLPPDDLGIPWELDVPLFADSPDCGYEEYSKERKRSAPSCRGLGGSFDDIPVFKPEFELLLAQSKQHPENPCNDEQDVVCCPDEAIPWAGSLAVSRCRQFKGIIQCALPLKIDEEENGFVYCCNLVLGAPDGTLDGWGCVKTPNYE